MRSVLFAYHDIGCEAIRTLHKMGEEICAIFTHQDDPSENLWFGSVMKCAKDFGIPVYAPESPNHPEWIEKIQTIRPDIIFSFYYRKLVCDDILLIPPKGGFNLHGSLLPKYRGRTPVNWAIIQGEKETGVTLHYMVKKPDAGDIVCQKKVPVAETDTALTLYKKFVPLTRSILVESVPLLAQGTAPRIPQDESKATLFGGRKPEDGKIDWTTPSQSIYNLVRAVTHPYPGAFTFFKGKKVFIWWSQYDGKLSDMKSKPEKPGTIVSLNPFIVNCGEGSLIIRQIQTEGDSETDGQEWIKRNKIEINAILGGH